jgi:hypothetical protein
MPVKSVVTLGFRTGDAGFIHRLGFTYNVALVPGKGYLLLLPERTLSFELRQNGHAIPSRPAATQSSSERIAYTVEVYRMSTSPHSPEVLSVTDLSTGADVTSSVMPSGAPVFVAGAGGATLLVLPLLQSLTAGREYRIDCAFMVGSSSYRTFDFHVGCRSGSVEAGYSRGLPYQSEGERRAYVIDATSWAKTVSSPTVPEVIDENDGTDVKGTVMLSQTPQAVKREITLPLVHKLTAGHRYRVQV